MSFRLMTNRLAKQSRYFLQWYCKRNIFTNILEQGKSRKFPTSLSKARGNSATQIVLRDNNKSLFRFGEHARKLFVDNILNRVTTTYSAELRNQATKKLFYGDSAPFFALIGVSLASGAGVLTKEDELEGVCWEIREAASKVQNQWSSENISKYIDEDFNIDQLNVGPPIAKGCAAVVYAAALKVNKPQHCEGESVNVSNVQSRYSTRSSFIPEMMSPIQNISRFVHNFGGSVDNLHLHDQNVQVDGYFNRNMSLSSVKSSSSSLHSPSRRYSKSRCDSISETSISEEGLFGIRSSAELLVHEIEGLQTGDASICQYPLALKMMFNYDIQSNALSILRAMYKETVPARRRLNSETTNEWEKLLQNQTLTLPPHPNIVQMFGYFCGEVRNFRDGHILYPIAQPPRINPHGYGRNMSLYLLMKRYDCSLRNFLDGEVNTRDRVLLFAQLLEAVTHLNRHGIAHRDLKSDNILIELNDDDSPPLLVLSDFGCCLADKVHGLQIPYNSLDIDRGGNAALMAPEIINKTPGTFSILNYSKADLWACGAIAYEIFGQKNPFYSYGEQDGSGDAKVLRNVNYTEDELPELGAECPSLVQKLIFNILSPNPNRRLSPDVAANVIQLYLWAPSLWLKSGGMPSSPEVLQWLLSLTTKVLYEGKQGNDVIGLAFRMGGRRTYVEYILICSFLSRARLRRIRGALSWIHSVI